ncbi:MAG: hypothetical protein IJN42_01845 [Clostridia bacterium]|nr:hypothetical protein [Clostridia bacterium]
MKEKTIEHRGYEATQASNGHVMVFQDGAACMHVSFTEEITEEELREVVDDCISVVENKDFMPLRKEQINE